MWAHVLNAFTVHAYVCCGRQTMPHSIYSFGSFDVWVGAPGSNWKLEFCTYCRPSVDVEKKIRLDRWEALYGERRSKNLASETSLFFFLIQVKPPFGSSREPIHQEFCFCSVWLPVRHYLYTEIIQSRKCCQPTRWLLVIASVKAFSTHGYLRSIVFVFVLGWSCINLTIYWSFGTF